MNNPLSQGLTGMDIDAENYGKGAAPRPDPGQSPGAEALYPALPEGDKVRILIVDDVPHKLLALESVLAGPDIIIEKAVSGYEALRRLLRVDFANLLEHLDAAHFRHVEIEQREAGITMPEREDRNGSAVRKP